jgi:hypothetical protein
MTGWYFIVRIVGIGLLILLLTTASFANSELASVLERAPVMNPNLSAFPESSLVDRSAGRKPPAGALGFLSVKHGKFFFADGTRARFFGINLAKDAVFTDKATIDRLAGLFARAGINLVRIHHIDDTQGILDPDPKRYFRPERLDLVDYWVAKLKERGIYVCLDLNDYRTFRTADGVVNGEKLGRGAKPYAVFDQRLIELQEEYARRFLVDHVNPYTKLSYADDPAIAMLEIYDENGLFIRRGDWPNLHEPYKSAFQQQWNAWLRYKYGSTAKLRAAWTDRQGYCALTSEESLEAASAQLPRMDLGYDLPQPVTNPLLAPQRVSDGALFAADIQRDYLTAMMRSLREMGVKAPITAVGAQDLLPDLATTAETTDYIGINYYFDHPVWEPGKDWTMPSFFSLRSPLQESGSSFTFPAVVSLARMHNKPLVVREWGYCYPNPHRGVGMVEAAAYGALLDLDALILFTYDARPSVRAIGYFDVHVDPLRWGLVAQASRLFLSGEVQPSKCELGIGYSLVDIFTWHNYALPLYHLGYVTRVANYTRPDTRHPFDLLVSSGRSCGSAWQGERLLLFANRAHTDLLYQGAAEGQDVLAGYQLATGRGGAFDFTFRGIGYDAGGVKTYQAWPAYTTADLEARGLQPIATSDSLAMGFIDRAKKVIGFRNLHPDLAQRVALDALKLWAKAPVSHNDLDANCWRADTGQIVRDFGKDQLRIVTPTVQVIAGKLESEQPMGTGEVKVATTTPIGVLVAESLDGKPLTRSGALLVKMTTRARNDRTKIFPDPGGPKPHKLVALGTAPISTEGKPAEQPTRVEIDGKMLIELNLQNGSWEYLVEGNRALLYLDTGDTAVTFPRTPALVRWHSGAEVVEFTPESASFTIPAGVHFTEVRW